MLLRSVLMLLLFRDIVFSQWCCRGIDCVLGNLTSARVWEYHDARDPAQDTFTTPTAHPLFCQHNNSQSTAHLSIDSQYGYLKAHILGHPGSAHSQCVCSCPRFRKLLSSSSKLQTALTITSLDPRGRHCSSKDSKFGSQRQRCIPRGRDLWSEACQQSCFQSTTLILQWRGRASHHLDCWWCPLFQRAPSCQRSCLKPDRPQLDCHPIRCWDPRWRKADPAI